MASPATSSLQGRTTVLLGYGNQGRGQALNLRDTGLTPLIALHKGSPRRDEAAAEGFSVVTPEEGAARADVLSFLIPDEVQGEAWDVLKPHLKPGATLVFAHGFAVHYSLIAPPAGSDVILVAPKGAGSSMRYREAASLAVHQNVSGEAGKIAEDYARAIVGPVARLIETTFEEETVSDLFGEQASLCGGVPALVKAAFETAVENGVSPEMAYYDIVQELKLIADLIAAKGPAAMYEAVSDTAEFGAYGAGDRIIGAQAREAMKALMADIRSGDFARRWLDEARTGRRETAARREANRADPIERAGRTVRGEEK